MYIVLYDLHSLPHFILSLYRPSSTSGAPAYKSQALEVIPRQLCDNAGLDATNVLNRLRHKHAQGGTWFGVDIFTEDIADNLLATVWEPAVVKINALTAATEAACLLLSVDETIKNPTSNVVCI